MNLNNFATMDVNMLLSLVNMQLRDRFDDLDDLCKATTGRIRNSSDRDPDHNPANGTGPGAKS